MLPTDAAAAFADYFHAIYFDAIDAAAPRRHMLSPRYAAAFSLRATLDFHMPMLPRYARDIDGDGATRALLMPRLSAMPAPCARMRYDAAHHACAR